MQTETLIGLKMNSLEGSCVIENLLSCCLKLFLFNLKLPE